MTYLKRYEFDDAENFAEIDSYGAWTGTAAPAGVYYLVEEADQVIKELEAKLEQSKKDSDKHVEIHSWLNERLQKANDRIAELEANKIETANLLYVAALENKEPKRKAAAFDLLERQQVEYRIVTEHLSLDEQPIFKGFCAYKKTEYGWNRALGKTLLEAIENLNGN